MKHFSIDKVREVMAPIIEAATKDAFNDGVETTCLNIEHQASAQTGEIKTFLLDMAKAFREGVKL